jgi:hypothetical protein
VTAATTVAPRRVAYAMTDKTPLLLLLRPKSERTKL